MPPPTTTAQPPERLVEPDLAAQRVIPLRHPGRWIATAVVLVVLAQFVHGLVTNPFYQWDRFAYWFLRPVILDGLLVTLKVTALQRGARACSAAIVLALARLSRSPVLQRGELGLHLAVPLGAR